MFIAQPDLIIHDGDQMPSTFENSAVSKPDRVNVAKGESEGQPHFAESVQLASSMPSMPSRFSKKNSRQDSGWRWISPTLPMKAAVF